MTRRKKDPIDARVEAAYYATCSGIAIDISKVFAAGRIAATDGADDETLRTKIRAFVDTIRKN